MIEISVDLGNTLKQLQTIRGKIQNKTPLMAAIAEDILKLNLLFGF